METDLPEWLQPFTEGSSTDVSPPDVDIPPPAFLPSANAPAKPISAAQEESTIYSLISRKTRIAKCADARKLRERHAEEILTTGRTELKLPKDRRCDNSRPQGSQ